MKKLIFLIMLILCSSLTLAVMPEPITIDNSELIITKYDGVEAQTYLPTTEGNQLCLYHKANTNATSLEELRQLISEAQESVDNWSVNISYKVNDLVKYNDLIYKVLQAHTSQSDWTPDVVPALFVEYAFQELGEVPQWVQPTGGHDAYNIDDRVWFEVNDEKLIYESLINANVWSPTAYPAGWNEIGKIKETETYGNESITAINELGSSIIVPRDLEDGLSTYCVNVTKTIQIGTNTIIAEYINSTLYIYPTDTLELEPFTVELYCNDVQILYPDVNITSEEPIEERIKFQWEGDINCEGKLTFRQNKLETIKCSNTFFLEDCEKSYIDYSDFLSSNINEFERITDEFSTYILKNDTINYPDGWDGWYSCVAQSPLNPTKWYDCMNTPLTYDTSYYGNFTDLDPSLQVVFSSTNDIIYLNQTNVSTHGLSLKINESAWGLYDNDRISPYIYNSGDFKSLVFYNSTSSYWNITQSIADSNGSAEVYNLCQADDNCRAYYPMDMTGGNNLSEDRKGSYHGNLIGTNNGTGISSGSLRFDQDDYINISEGFDYSQGAVSFWVNVQNTATSNIMTLFRKVGNPAFSTDASLCQLSTTTASSAYLYCGVLKDNVASWYWNDNGNTERNLFNTGWHHIVLQADSTGNEIWFDNQEVTDDITYTTGSKVNTSWFDYSSGNTGFYIGASLSIGNMGGFLDNSFIDEFNIYNNSLTPLEIDSIFKAGLSQHANANVTLQTRVADSYNISDVGLVSLWGLNGNALDETGVNNGTWTNGAMPLDNSGVVGMGGYFDGVNDYVNTSYDPIWTTEDNLTISLWVNARTIPSSEEMIFASIAEKGATDPTFGIEVEWTGHATTITSGALALYIRNNTGGVMSFNDNEGVETVVAGTGWHHIAVTRDVGWQMYVDGVEQYSDVAKAMGSLDFSGYPFFVGCRNERGSPNQCSDSSIDELRIYNRSLSLDEIQNLYELGSYHIEWNDWEDEGVKSDGVPKTSTSSGKFMQFKDVFATDNTNVSAYVLNYSVSSTYIEPETTPPTFDSGSPYNMSVLDNESVIQQINATDETALDSFWINDTTRFQINNSGYFQNKTVLTYGTYWITVSVNDTSGNINSSLFYVEVNQSELAPIVNIIYPTATTYSIEQTYLNYTVVFSDGDGQCWYSLDNGITNSTATAPMNYTGLSNNQGENNWSVYCNNSMGNVGMDSVTFQWSDTANPSLTILSPLSGQIYGQVPQPLICSIEDDNHDKSWWNIGGVNTIFTGNQTTMSITSTGTYTVTVYVNDTFGNINSTSVTFDYAYGEDEPITITDIFELWQIYNSTSGITTNISYIGIDGRYCNLISGVCGS